MTFGLSSLGGLLAFAFLMCGQSSALEDSSDALDFYKRLYDFGKRDTIQPGFGLGKRAEDRDRLYAYGLGNRAFGKSYSFGIGKRDQEEEDYGDDGDEWGETKRARQLYSFGLGKRARQYAFGIGKRPRTYSFGIGKRYPRYGFGIGKRDEEEEDAMDKRRDHRFSFGLGKREVSPLELDSMEDKQYDDFNTRFEEDKRADAKGRTQFGRAGRRTYSFGLGKRIPLYDFGLGKRTERDVTTNATSESGNTSAN